jgi:hypothetical protein
VALEKIEELYQSEAEAAVFFQEARIQTVPDILIKSTGQVCKEWPLSEADAAKLAAAGTDAPFGRGTETLLDKSVRSCRQLNPDQFEIKNKVWNDFFSDSTKCATLEGIRKELAPNTSKISAQLYKMLIYPEGGFFSPHVDTLRDPNMFGTLVVELPGNYYRGNLVITHPLGAKKIFYGGRSDVWLSTSYGAGGKMVSQYYNWDKVPPKSTKCNMIAFYTDMKHEIEKIEKGYRITLVYNLLRTGDPIQLPKKTFGDKVLDQYRKLFSGPMPKNFSMEKLAVLQVSSTPTVSPPSSQTFSRAKMQSITKR